MKKGADASILVQIAPKEDELRAFQAYQGTYEDLSPPEQFLYVMATVPRLNDKINVLILMHQFEVSYKMRNHSCLYLCSAVSIYSCTAVQMSWPMKPCGMSLSPCNKPAV